MSLLHCSPTDSLDPRSACSFSPSSFGSLLHCLFRQSQMGEVSEEDRKTFREKYRPQNITTEELNRFLAEIPVDLLFVLRTSNYLRVCHGTLGGRMKDRITIFSMFAVDGTHVSNEAHLRPEQRSKSTENSRTLAQRHTQSISLAKRTDDPVLSSRLASRKLETSFSQFCSDCASFFDRSHIMFLMVKQSISIQIRAIFGR